MKFQTDYCDEYQNPIVFYVGRLTTVDTYGKYFRKIYIWASNEFFEEKFFLLGTEDETGETVERAKRMVKILNAKAKKFMVPKDFDDWVEDLSEGEMLAIMSSSKKDNSKFK